MDMICSNNLSCKYFQSRPNNCVHNIDTMMLLKSLNRESIVRNIKEILKFGYKRFLGPSNSSKS